MASTIDQLQVIISASTDEFERKMNGLTSAGGPLARIGIAATAAAAAAGAAFAGLAAKGIGEFTQFETAFAEVLKLLPDMSDDAKNALIGDIREVAREYGISADEVSSALALALSSGVDASVSME